MLLSPTRGSSADWGPRAAQSALRGDEVMTELIKIQVVKGIFWVEAPEAGIFVLCGCPADSVKHLMKRGLIGIREERGTRCETGPNAILLSDILVQNGAFSNLAEFPVLQMLYRQGMIIPGHPGNTGQKPLLIGSKAGISAQMDYIRRGNYGLLSEEELRDAGIGPAEAHDMMRIKLKFAFGKIRRTEELLEGIVVGNEPVEIRNGVSVQRLRLNVFEFRYKNQSVTVDLNLAPGLSYESPYPIGFHKVEKEYFAIVHAGEGDGWDPRRPAISSVLIFQGKVYLIDAGPNILHSLRALGIGISEVEGIFHTHAHDDHFCGLATLMRCDHRIKYYSTPMVRASVARKLSALVSRPEGDFADFFEVCDLDSDVWNDIEGLEVCPTYSPHPVDTNIMFFRAMARDGYKTYAHLADIVSLNVLAGMITEDDSEPGLSRDFYNAIAKRYLQKADLKKIDIGGGLIHGDAEDFKKDPSGKILLSHTPQELSGRQKEIGSGAPFGTVDTLIATHQDYLRTQAYDYLQACFPHVPPHRLRLLANNPITTFNPESAILRSGATDEPIRLILTGEVEMVDTKSGVFNILSAGALVGEIPALDGSPSRETYLAMGFVKALELPRDLYLHFLSTSGLQDAIVRLQERRQFLQKTWLFGESISYPIQNRIAQAMRASAHPERQNIAMDTQRQLCMVMSGRVQLCLENDIIETLRTGDFFGEERALFNTPCLFKARTLEETVLQEIPWDALRDIPVVRWKLIETYARRIEMISNPGLLSSPIFQWRQEYSTGVREMDEDHRELFRIVDSLYQVITTGEEQRVLEGALRQITQYAEHHFKREESLMEKIGFPGRGLHEVRHAGFLEEILEMKKRADRGEVRQHIEFVNFFKDWIINHILTEDRKYGPYFAPKGAT